jgi:uncharacterized protein (DUF1499 family)
MSWWQIALVAAAVVAVGYVAFMIVLSATARRPPDLGATGGRLAACPASPNCVSTQAADDAHRIDPLTYAGTAAEAMERLKAVLAAHPRTKVATATDAYLHAECTTALFRFVDDVEFLIDDENKVIHFRSASRVGRSDLGVNRKRMEAIRAAFQR